MTDIQPSAFSVVFVTVNEGVSVQMPAAFLAGAVRCLGAAMQRIAVDFCTDPAVFQSTIAQSRATAVLFPYHPEFREVLNHLTGLAADAGATAVALVGEALAEDPHPPQTDPRVALIPRDPGLALGEALASVAVATAPGHDRVPAALDLFGAALADDPMSASWFAELGTVGLCTRRTTPDEVSPTALLARVEAPLRSGAVPLPSATALAPLDSQRVAPTRVSLYDRDCDDHGLEIARLLAARGIAVEARLDIRRWPTRRLVAFAEAGVDRVILEIDRAPGAPEWAGTMGEPAAFEPYVVEARRLGLEIGVLLVVGVPGETRSRGLARTAAVRALAPDRLRCIAFEPTLGTPTSRALAAAGLIDLRRREWNRELHRPIIAPDFGLEDFLQNTADAFLLLAEVESRRSEAP